MASTHRARAPFRQPPGPEHAVQLAHCSDEAARTRPWRPWTQERADDRRSADFVALRTSVSNHSSRKSAELIVISLTERVQPFAAEAAEMLAKFQETASRPGQTTWGRAAPCSGSA